MFAQGWTIELLMILYRVWHVAPFAFIIFYAGLQTLNQDFDRRGRGRRRLPLRSACATSSSRI